MYLVPIDYQRKYNSLENLKKPIESELKNNISEKSLILESKHLTDDQKQQQLSQNSNNFSVLSKKVLNIEPIPTPFEKKINTPNFSILPKTSQNFAHLLLQELNKHSDKFQIDESSQEIILNGKKLHNSNMQDIFSDLLRNRKSSVTPLHGNEFLKFLAKLNIPEEFIKNKKRLETFRKLKQREFTLNNFSQANNDLLLSPSNAEMFFNKIKKITPKKLKISKKSRGIKKVKKVQWLTK